jgi:hypothetical protein
MVFLSRLPTALAGNAVRVLRELWFLPVIAWPRLLTHAKACNLALTHVFGVFLVRNKFRPEVALGAENVFSFSQPDKILPKPVGE